VNKTFLMLALLITAVFLIDSMQVSPASEDVPDGKSVEYVNCSGYGKDWTDCHREAKSLCPGGYTVMEKSTGVVSAPVNGRYTLVPSKEMTVQCRKSQLGR